MIDYSTVNGYPVPEKLRNSLFDSTMIRQALLFAVAAHAAVGHLRPTLDDPNVPYIIHPMEVAETILGTDDATTSEVIAALLHDVLEDTDVSRELLHELFGRRVANIVEELTDVYTPVAFITSNRALRKEWEAQRYEAVSRSAKKIKLADGLSNTPSIAVNKPDFMPIYGKEMRRLLESLRGADGLWGHLDECLQSYGY